MDLVLALKLLRGKRTSIVNYNFIVIEIDVPDL